MGVISSIPLQFEFSTDWSRFAMMTGKFFGNILGYGTAMAFMLEAGFLGIMLFGWMWVPNFYRDPQDLSYRSSYMSRRLPTLLST